VVELVVELMQEVVELVVTVHQVMDQHLYKVVLFQVV
jgi:hypothetical protein